MKQGLQFLEDTDLCTSGRGGEGRKLFIDQLNLFIDKFSQGIVLHYSPGNSILKFGSQDHHNFVSTDVHLGNVNFLNSGKEIA